MNQDLIKRSFVDFHFPYVSHRSVRGREFLSSLMFFIIIGTIRDAFASSNKKARWHQKAQFLTNIMLSGIGRDPNKVIKKLNIKCKKYN